MKTLAQLVLITVMNNLMAEERPNFIFIMADDLGWNDVSWHNKKMPTKNLHNLAVNGAILNQSYVNQVCSPTRSAFLTGYYPYHLGLQGDAVFTGMEPSGVPLKFPFLSERMQSTGYRTYMVGKWHLGYCNQSYIPSGRGFDYFYGLYTGKQDYYTHHYYYTASGYHMDGLDLWDQLQPQFRKHGIYSTELYADKAIELIWKTDSEKPFFMYLAFTAPHYPLQVPNKYLEPCRQYRNRKRRIYCGDGVNQWEMISKDGPGFRHSLVYNIYGKTAAIRKGRYKLIVGNPKKPSGWIPEPTARRAKIVATGNSQKVLRGPWLFDLKGSRKGELL